MTTHDKAYFIKEFGVPERFLSMVMEIPPLLPGERSEDFFAFFQTMLNELVPSTDLEWFLTVDIAWILWDLQRYRRWKNVIIALNQRAALGEALMLTDPHYTTVGPTETMRKKSQLKADGLKGNLKADPALARELDEYGYNQDALNALSFMKGVASLEVIEKFIVSAHHRLMMTLREVAVRREFTARTRLIEKRILAERPRVDTNPQASITSTGQAVTKK